MFVSNGSLIAKAGLERIAQLYGIEEKIRDEPLATRQAIRWTESAPLVNAFGVWLDKQRSRVSPRSRHRSRLMRGTGACVQCASYCVRCHCPATLTSPCPRSNQRDSDAPSVPEQSALAVDPWM